MTTSERLLPRDTRAALQSLPVKDCSRSLYFDRFSRPDLDKDDRKQFFTTGFDAHRSSVRAENWAAAMRLDPAQRLFAQLQSRLMVNMAGGVMENAGLCLDRFGLPYIPGSAVKGCARRAAVAALHEWCETGVKPTGDGNLFTAACASFNSPAEMLAAIARVFGWGEEDWDMSKLTKDGRVKSDFAWAVGVKVWPDVIIECGRTLLRKNLKSPKDFGHFAGSVSFLPAYPVDLGKTGKVDGLPVDVPVLGKLELDIVTCHHGKYYAGEMLVATDTEEPVPVIFPAVAAGHVFAFALLPLRVCNEKLLADARVWLTTGLQTFGLGAKTAAGYGWFNASSTVQVAVRNALDEIECRERETRQREKADQERKVQEQERLRMKQEREAAFAGLSGDALADKEIELLTEQPFDVKLRAFCKDPKKGGPTEEQKKAIVRSLRGPRLAYWQAFKAKAIKGDLAATANAIRELSKQMLPGKEGKMP